MGDVLLLDRHVLASPATAYDTAWTTYGATPGVRGRAGRLEEEVPWGTRVTRVADPARLSGKVGEVLAPSNLDRLGQAVLPVQAWIGYSLWGAFGRGSASRGRQGERRVLTHTLLLSAAAFRRIEGHPAGLLRHGGGPARWLRDLAESSDFTEPQGLDPVRVPVDADARAALARGRLEEMARLRRVVLETSSDGDPQRLRRTLGTLYEALARCWSGDDLRHVAVQGVGVPTSALLRLVWLSLPLDDRIEASFVTEQRRSERPRARLLGLPGTEWGRSVPEGSWVLGENEPFEPTPGRELWAARVAAPDFPAGFGPLDARARARRWRLVGSDDLDAEADLARWRRRWREGGPTWDALRELAAVEAGRQAGPRTRAVGAALGRMAAEAPAGPAEPGSDAPGGGGGRVELSVREAWLRGALDLVAELPPGWPVPVVRGAVRSLRRSGPAGRIRAGLLRCRCVAEEWVPAGEIDRLVDRESDALRALLLELPGRGGAEVIVAAAPSAAADDRVGRELVRIAVDETRWTVEGVRALAGAFAGSGSADEGVASILLSSLAAVSDPGAAPDLWQGLVASAPRALLGTPVVTGILLDALEAGREPFGAARSPGRIAVAEALARCFLEAAPPRKLGPESAEIVLRLLWTAGSDGALDVLGDDTRLAAGVLAELLVHPAPVPLFHRIRMRLSALLDAAPEADPNRAGGEPRRSGRGTRLPRAWQPATTELRARLESYAPGLLARPGRDVRERSVFLARGR